MTIDEAIAREMQQAEMHRNDIVPKENYHNMPWVDKSNEENMRSAEEHEHIAEWLEELKVYQQHEIICNKGYNAGYNKAVDDFIKMCDEVKICETYDCVLFYDIEHIAEQLKAGGENDNLRR